MNTLRLLQAKSSTMEVPLLVQPSISTIVYFIIFSTLIIAFAQNYAGINKFQVYADPNYGIQYAGQFSMHGASNNRLIGKPNWFFHIWFWTAVDDEAFTVFSVGPSGKETSETVASDS